MPFKTPKFWYKPRGILSALLTPVSWLYQIGHFINQKIAPTAYHSKIPVICIGNAIAGGSGKTPTVISLVTLLKENGVFSNPHILTRGYGSDINKPTLVDTSVHTAKDVGDEAILLTKVAPTIISPDRSSGAKLAEENGADIIIMDDGLQNNTLRKDLTFLVIDRQIDFGNGKIIPAGPLRDSLASILDKTDCVICIGRPLQSDKEVFEASIKPQSFPDKNKKYIAFAGIGLPEKFKNTLLDLNTNLIGWYPFPDHHPFTSKDIELLKKEAQEKEAMLITTEKDYVRLDYEIRADIETLPISLEFKEAQSVIGFIRNKLEERR